MVARALWGVLAALLGACHTGSIRRDLDVSGELPRVIGLGAFAPSCVLFCFVDNHTTQGDVQREEIVTGQPFIVHDKSSAAIKLQPPQLKKGKQP
jgi:hypothetical protein